MDRVITWYASLSLNLPPTLLHNSSNTTQEEAVSENLKNMLLVMSSAGVLAPPDEKPEQEEMWSETWKRINRFLPGLFTELFPEEERGSKVALPERKGEGSPRVRDEGEAKEARVGDGVEA